METVNSHLNPDRVHIEALQKGIVNLDSCVDSGEIASLGLNLLREDLSLPVATLSRENLLHNLEWMRRFIQDYGVNLAPHGKTTMAPKLYKMQLEAGAWGITLATAHQTAVACRHGVRRVLMANQLIGLRNCELISEMIGDPGFEFYCLVDSADLIDILGGFFGSRQQRLNVLLEVGTAGSRAGVRNEAQVNECLDAIARNRDGIRLCGIELYEGIFKQEAPVRRFIAETLDLARNLLDARAFERKPFILSGAGSAWFDIVAEMFTAAEFGDASEIVLRPGCYLTHDAGAYVEAQDRMALHNPVAREIGTKLRAALKLWGYVQSIPESGLAIVTVGKRDASFDSGLPKPWVHFRPGSSEPSPVSSDWEVTKLMDQHAFLQFDPLFPMKVGDIVGFDIAHPCLTFDKWRFVPVIDHMWNVVDVVQTFF